MTKKYAVTECPITLFNPDPFYTNWWILACLAALILGFGKQKVCIINLHTGEVHET